MATDTQFQLIEIAGIAEIDAVAVIVGQDIAVGGRQQKHLIVLGRDRILQIIDARRSAVLAALLLALMLVLMLLRLVFLVLLSIVLRFHGSHMLPFIPDIS